AEATQLPKPTVYRLLVGLSYQDLVIEVDGAGSYALGPGCLRLAEAATGGNGLGMVAMSVLERIWAETGDTVTLHVRGGLRRVCITELISSGPLRYVSGVGESSPVHVGAAGRVLLAFLPLAEQRELVDQLAQETPGLDTAALLSALADVRQQGWATSFGER